MYQSGKSKRRVVCLNSETHATIEVKLWGDKTDLQTPQIGSEVIMYRTVVDDQQGKKSVNSTAKTEFKVLRFVLHIIIIKLYLDISI